MDNPANSNTPFTPEQVTALLAGKRILSIDDSITIHRLLQVVLKKEQVIMDDAEDVRTAEAKLKHAVDNGLPYDLVFLDINMPGHVLGTDLLARMRADPALQSIPVIMMTSESSREIVENCARLGIQGFLIKPPERQRILQEACRVLSHLPAASLAEMGL